MSYIIILYLFLYYLGISFYSTLSLNYFVKTVDIFWRKSRRIFLSERYKGRVLSFGIQERTLVGFTPILIFYGFSFIMRDLFLMKRIILFNQWYNFITFQIILLTQFTLSSYVICILKYYIIRISSMILYIWIISILISFKWFHVYLINWWWRLLLFPILNICYWRFARFIWSYLNSLSIRTLLR